MAKAFLDNLSKRCKMYMFFFMDENIHFNRFKKKEGGFIKKEREEK